MLYPAITLCSLLSGIQRVLQLNKVLFNLFDKSDLWTCTRRWTLCVALRKYTQKIVEVSKTDKEQFPQ